MPSRLMPVTARGAELLRNPILNKGTAFTHSERGALGLTGLLPPHVSTLAEQCERVLQSFRREPTALDRYIYLRSLQDRNETLFYAALMQNLAEMLPIVYTPTVAEGVERFSHIFQTHRGLYITPDDIDSIDTILRSAGGSHAGIIVVTDNEGILGIGDQGIGGIGIPIGKLALYVAAGGFPPAACLPISLDVGTENASLLEDPLYVGVRRRRPDDTEYAAFIDAFVEGVKRQCPHAVLQWEDFSRDRAMRNLERYRQALPSLNDDIQGTAAVACAAIRGGLKLAGREFRDEVICILGAGAAGVGVAEGLEYALRAAGLGPEAASAQVLSLDSRGLVMADRPDLPEYKRRIATDPSVTRGWRISAEDPTLGDVIANARPTTLIGLSGVQGAITETAVRAVCDYCDRPLVFPLSNPSANCEAHPHKIVSWSDGRAIVAVGSPFPPVEHNGRTHAFPQANNIYVFPGIGVGAHMSGARWITDHMLTAAAEALHGSVSNEELEAGLLLPPFERIREVSAKVATAVMRAAEADGVAETNLPPAPEAYVADWQYVPRYLAYVPA